jgi:hypothetical protein
MFTRCATRVANTVRRFHEDEAGNESLQTIMIMAIGALVMVDLHHIWKNNMQGEVINKLTTMFSLDFTN